MKKLKLFSLALMALFSMSMWATDVDVVLDQIRVVPTKAGLVKVSVTGNITASSGKLSVASNKNGTFTIASTNSTEYKVKGISFTLNRTPSSFSCTDGGAVADQGSNIWKFTPTDGNPVASATFSIASPSSSVTVGPITVTLTTEATNTIEELKTFTLADNVFSFTSSEASSQITITNKSGASASSNYINLSKSSNERSLTIAAKTGYVLKFISFYYYDSANDPSVTPSVTTYTTSTYTWKPSTPTTSVDFSFDASSAGIKIWKIFAGYASAGYSITYEENGHGEAQTDLIGQTALPDPLPTLSETGWIFDGWFTDNGTFETPAVAGNPISENTTLYAKWTEDPSVVKYHVTYVLNGPTGDAPTQADAAEGAVITLADEPDWDGHGFLGWNDGTNTYAAGASYTMPGADVEFTAQWCTEITPVLSYNYTIVYPSFGVDILPTVTGNTGAGTVTYESSNASVAEVDENTGAITPVAAGSVTITATIAANGGYCENTAAATIKVVAAPTHLVEQRLANGNSVAWDASVIVTTDNINVSGLTALSNHGAAVVDGTGKSGMTSKIKTVADSIEANYVELSFTIAEGKKMDVSTVGVKVQSVTSDVNNFRVVLSDDKGSDEIIGTKKNAANGSLVDVDFSSYGTLKGTVTLRVYAWGWTAGYRFGTGITIDGTIKDIATSIDNTADDTKAIKRIENGQLIIEKNGVRYNAMGQIIR